MAPPMVQEIEPKSVLTRVQADRYGFRWTINPYRGCQHACVYCFARNTHTYLGMNAGNDFNNRIVVKQRAAAVLRRKLQRPGWRRELIMLGTAVDPWQPVEAKHRITCSLLRVLRDFANPIGALTKSVLVTRDADYLSELAQVGSVHVNFTVGTLDERVWKLAEPGTPHPRRLGALTTLVRAGVPAGVMLAPLMPGLNDSRASIEAVVRAAAEHGARSVTPVVLNLRPGSKDWFMGWLPEAFPHLVESYARLYQGSGAYVPPAYEADVRRRVEDALARWGFDVTPVDAGPPRGQLALAL
ncbi:MAG: radical SAM protein [Dehalococcoidia bacterium]|nr:radical SAM protein [Dehalococcoidia bacterium]